MSLTLLAGIPAGGTTAVFHDAVRAAVRDGRSAALLLPTLPDVRRAQKALTGECPFGLEVGQLDRAIETQWSLYGDGRVLVGRVERRILLEKAWREIADDLPDGRGVLDLLVQLSRRSAEVEPRQTPSRRMPAATAALVAAVVRYRELLLERGRVEAGEAARLLAGCAPSPADLVVVHRFTDLGLAQQSVLESWARQADVTVTLPYDPALPATLATATLVERLRSGRAVLLQAGRRDGEGELAEVARSLFVPGARVEAQGAVSLGVAQGEEGEAEIVAGHVLRAIQAGTPPERVAVAFRDPGRHYRWLRRLFEQEGIPADYDISLRAGETPLGRALLALWAFASGGFDRTDLLAFLRSPYSGADPSAVDAADERWRSSRMQSGPALLNALARGADARSLVEHAIALARAPLNPESAIQWKGMADRLLANGYPTGLPTLDGGEIVDAATHRGFVAAVDVLSSMPGSVPAQAVEAFAAATTSPMTLERPGRVQVLSVERLRSRRFDVVVLGGLTAGEFPRRGSGDVLEGDGVREAMEALSIPFDPASELANERLLFHLAVTRARTALVLVRQDSDEEGRAVRRSVFWDEFLDLYGGEDAIEEGEGLLAYPATAVSANGRRNADAIITRRHGVLRDPDVLKALSQERSFSPSEIEAYLACPYSWYLGRVLRPTTPDSEVDAMVRGAVAHDAIRRFYEAFAQVTGAQRVTGQNLDAALALVPGAVEAALREAPEAHTLEEAETLARVGTWVHRLVERDAAFLPGYAPLEHEWGFGIAGGEPIDVGGLLLKGRADRIDLGPEGIVIVDYKGGTATPQAAFEREGKVQLQLYALAASASTGWPVAGGLYRSLSKAEDRGFMTSEYEGPGISRNDRIDRAVIDALLERAVEQGSEAVEGMLAGRIAPSPGTSCQYCAAAAFCDEARR